MQSAFKAAMLKLSTLGQNLREMVDCSDIIPVPKALTASEGPHFPPGLTRNDVDQAVRPFLTCRSNASCSYLIFSAGRVHSLLSLPSLVSIYLFVSMGQVSLIPSRILGPATSVPPV